MMCVCETNKYTNKDSRRESRIRANHETGKVSVRCLKCSEWRDIELYNVNPQTRLVARHCTICKGNRRREWKSKRNTYEKARRVRLRAQTEWADVEYARWQTRCEKGGSALIDLTDEVYIIVLGWIEKLRIQFGSYEAVASQANIQVRRIHPLVNREQEKLSVEIIEKLADTANGDLEKIIPTGKDGWSLHGHRHCEDCGSWWHPYHAAGRCRRCYNNYLRRGCIPDLGFWAIKYCLYACRYCRSNARPHRAHGLCGPCLARLRRHLERLEEDIEATG